MDNMPPDERVLIVDDEESICATLHRHLSREGFQVIAANTADEALRIARDEPIQVAIIDRMLGQGANGIELIAELKQLHPYCQTILISGQPSFESAAATMRYQTFAYLSKPFRRNTLCATVREATEEYRRRKNQGVQQAMFTSLFEATPEPVALCDARGEVLFANPGFCRAFGYAEEEARQKLLQELISFPDDIFEQTFGRVLCGETLPEFETVITGRNGTPCDVAVTLSLCSNPSARFQGVWVTLRDITLLKRLREEVLQTEKLSMLGSMTAKIVHQINNPTQVLTGYLELLQHNPNVPEDMHKYLKTMYEAAQMIKRLTGEFLNLSRPRPRVISVFRPEAPLEKAADFLFQAGQITYCKITKQYDEHAPMVQGDFQQLNQVFINLLVNAVHAMEDNREKLLSLMTCRQDDGSVIIAVRDNGCGIPQEVQTKIFDHFFTTRQDRGGTGLGLPMVKSVVEWHQGTVRVESEPGSGAAFIVTLPGYVAGTGRVEQAA